MSVVVARPMASAASTPLVRAQSRTLWGDAVYRFTRNRLAVAAFAVVAIFVLLAVFADVVSPYRYDYSSLAEANQFPSSQHWLGTDAVGRDLLSRLIYGARVSLTVGFSVQLFALLIGVTLGALAGAFG